MKKSSILAAVAVFAASVLTAQTLRLGGSDILRPVVADEVAKLSKSAGLDVSVDMRGTYLALPEILDGKSDVAIIVLPAGRKLPDGLRAFPFAFQAAVVVVNDVNPIEEISTKQLFDIYSRKAEPRAESWRQIGVSDVSLRDIMAISTSFSDNMVIELFKNSALDGSNLGTWVNMIPKKQDILNTIKTNNSAIAVVAKASTGDMMKVLPVSKSSGGSKSYAYKPDVESVSSGDYPMTLPFYIVFKPENQAKVKPLVKILLGEKIAKCLDDSDFYSAPENSRKKSIFELDLSK